TPGRERRARRGLPPPRGGVRRPGRGGRTRLLRRPPEGDTRPARARPRQLPLRARLRHRQRRRRERAAARLVAVALLADAGPPPRGPRPSRADSRHARRERPSTAADESAGGAGRDRLLAGRYAWGAGLLRRV